MLLSSGAISIRIFLPYSFISLKLSFSPVGESWRGIFSHYNNSSDLFHLDIL